MEFTAFRDPALARRLLSRIRRTASPLPAVKIMEVCGTHTMEIGRLGLRSLLPANVKLVSGPGCPVCVTPGSVIDCAAGLSLRPALCVVTFGDMVRVPGNTDSLQQARARGGRVEVVTTPAGMLPLAAANPKVDHVFLAVGFETTIPAIARVVVEVRERGLRNCFFLVAHRLVPPALEALVSDPGLGISGFLLPGHVCAVLGLDAFGCLERTGVPAVVTGFEPLDILLGVATVLDLVAAGGGGILNRYARVVAGQGNPRARELSERVFAPVDAVWRGLGVIPGSGLALRPEFEALDAGNRYGLPQPTVEMPRACACGEVLRGVISPDACPLFGRGCMPDSPVGPCMVSSEGSCAAHFRYGG